MLPTLRPHSTLGLRLGAAFALALNWTALQLTAQNQPTPTTAAASEAAPPPITIDPLTVQGTAQASSSPTSTTVNLEPQPIADDSIANLAAVTPNFFVGDNGAHGFNNTYELRGLTNTPIFGDPAVTAYIDDVPLGSAFTFPTGLAGFASAELFRGPGQNTIFGRAGSAGVLQFLTPDPVATPEGELRAGYGSYDAKSGSATENATAGGLDMYFGLSGAEREGYITNTLLGRTVDGTDGVSGLARLHWRVGDRLELTLLATGQDAHDGAQPLVPLGGPYYTVVRPAEGETDMEASNLGLTAAANLPAGRLSETTSYNYWALGPYSNLVVFNPGFGPVDLGDDIALSQRNWNEEVKFISAATPIHWSAGAFFTSGTTDGAAIRTVFGHPVEGSSEKIDNEDLSGFGEAVFPFDTTWSLTAGLRAESDRKSIDRVETVPAPGFYTLNDRSEALLPKLELRDAVTPETTLFASAGGGYKPGGFSSFTDTAALAAFGPERTTALEAGATRTTADGALSTTLRGFWYDITGYQIERTFATGGASNDYLVVNAPRARSIGTELETTWRPATGLTVAGGIGITDVTLTDFRDPFTGEVFNGKRAPYVPTFDANLRVDYRLADGWFVGATVTATGQTYYTEGDDPHFGQRPYGLLGARLGYETRRWRATLFGDNLTGEEYFSAISPGVQNGTPGAPRTIGIEVAVKF